ncbi:helix-turn-helix domain-containing protein [Actinophytocola sp.]|uniref:helix-turn-helix domain-containing protein n=1 Tax=Actinophytocola sp. TaxID=1872138 RepID=UPI0039C8620E
MACAVRVTGSVRRLLIRRARGQKTPYRDKIRARIVLLAAREWPNTRIATEVAVAVDTVRTWRGRFAAEGLAGLVDRPRSGRPSRFSAVQVAQVKALTCQLPADAWGAPGTVVVPGTGLRSRCSGCHRGDFGVDGAPMAGLRCDQALAVPVVAVSPRPRLRHQSRAGA